MNVIDRAKDGNLQVFKKYVVERKDAKGDAHELNFKYITRICFLDGSIETPLPESAALRLRFFLIEFSCLYRTAGGKCVTPSTMKGYIASIQRCLRGMGVQCALFSGHVFKDPHKGLVAALDNCFAKQLREGHVSRSHNTISLADLKNIFMHLNETSNTPTGYAHRLIVSVGVCTGLRPGALHLLKIGQVRKQKLKDEDCYVIHEIQGGVEGQSETAGSGLKNVGVRPLTIPIPNRSYFSDSPVNFFAIIDEYMHIRQSLMTASD